MKVEYKVNGDMIRQVRMKKGWNSAEELAEKLGSSAQYIYKIERNEKIPAFKFLLQIASVLEVPVGILLENGHGGQPGVFKVGVLEFEVAPELVEPIIKLIDLYNNKS